MPYAITFWSKPYLPTAPKNMIHKRTAAEAWASVQQLTMSDETVEITDPSGRVIEQQELKMLAEREAR